MGYKNQRGIVNKDKGGKMNKSIRQKYEDADIRDLEELKKSFEKDLKATLSWGERWFARRRLRLINKILERRSK